jgi:hypothetical protein
MAIDHAALVIETANFDPNADDELLGALDSVATQDALDDVDDVIVTVQPDDDARVRALCARALPRARVCHVAMRAYERHKLAAGTLAPDVVVLADSDCRYERGWLRALLDGIRDGGDVVAGDTRLANGGRHGRALAWLHGFPVDERELAPVHFNNVAMRTTWLRDVPYPRAVPVWRRPALFFDLIAAHGAVVVRAPTARAEHAAPRSDLACLERALLLGHDFAVALAPDGDVRARCRALTHGSARRRVTARVRGLRQARAELLPPLGWACAFAAGCGAALGLVSAGSARRVVGRAVRDRSIHWETDR